MLGVLSIPVAFATTSTTTEYVKAPISPKVEIIRVSVGNIDTTAIAVIVRDMAAKYGIDYNDFYNTLWCESHLVPQQSKVKDPSGPNGFEDSWGIPQIHLPDHPDVTKNQAMDIVWSIEWAAKEFKKDPTIWSCYKKLHTSPASTTSSFILSSSI